MDYPEKHAVVGTKNEKQNKTNTHHTNCVEHHYIYYQYQILLFEFRQT